VLLAALALLPALVPGRWLRAAAGLAALLAAIRIALGVSLFQSPQNFFVQLGSRFWHGVLAFYRVVLPLDPGSHPHMQQALLAGVFLFCLALGLAVAARRPVAACVVLVVGAGWPVTLLPGHAAVLRGALILGGCLLLLAGMREQARVRPLAALVLGALVLAGALAATTSPAVAKRELVHWQGWKVSGASSVSVAYVWNSTYSGLNWPKKRTTVLEIKAGPRPHYWRATTLDAFRRGHWVTALSPARPIEESAAGLDELATVNSLPRKARNPARWAQQAVTVESLRDPHLIAASVPVAFAHGALGAVSYLRGGVALAVHDPAPGDQYLAWSYAAHPSPKQLAATPAHYPGSIRADDLGTGGDRRAYRSLYRTARRVVGRAHSPYAAVIALESWFRESGGFTYDEHPPAAHGIPPLVSFLQTKRGYCQQFAGAMALMLRYLGIPARVAVGFTSGAYDPVTGTWVVTDHDAHAWVEAWFRGYGWLPFDPTPGRGTLGASYTTASRSFNPTAAAAAVAGAPKVRLLLQHATKSPALPQLRRWLPESRSHATARAPGGHSSRTPSLIGLIALLAAGVLTGITIFKFLRGRLRYLTRDPRRLGSACRRELVEYLADQRLELPPNASLGEIARVLGYELGVSALPFANAASQARFASPRDARRAALLARRELHQLRADLRKRLSALDRLRGAISLRSLRAG
jgi:transglutaminase-like putative cysteine protease